VIKPYLLIDFENVQPKALARLQPGRARIKVFLGEHQSKLLLDLVQALQPFGADAEYIQISGSGPDAVDFHIAFYIGRLSAADAGAAFTIISKDRGFDPLVRHLTKLGISCRRLTEIPASAAHDEAPPKPAAPPKPSTPAKKPAPAAAAKKPAARKSPVPTTARARARHVVERLRLTTRPARMSTLRSSIKSFFEQALDEKDIDAVIQSLQDSRKIVVDGGTVIYSLDAA
jgi:hypothetical protein